MLVTYNGLISNHQEKDVKTFDLKKNKYFEDGTSTKGSNVDGSKKYKGRS